VFKEYKPCVNDSTCRGEESRFGCFLLYSQIQSARIQIATRDRRTESKSRLVDPYLQSGIHVAACNSEMDFSRPAQKYATASIAGIIPQNPRYFK
jgi:hypothetical protein